MNAYSVPVGISDVSKQLFLVCSTGLARLGIATCIGIVRLGVGNSRLCNSVYGFARFLTPVHKRLWFSKLSCYTRFVH